MKTQPTQAMIDASPDMLKALQRLTHPMADDEDVEFALEVIRSAKDETSYEDVRESCRDKEYADRCGGHFWANC